MSEAVKSSCGDANASAERHASQRSEFRTHDANSLPFDIRDSLFKQFGSFSLAFSAAHQPGLQYFGNHTGFIAFGRSLGFTTALADPVTAPENRERLIDAFLKAYRKPAFLQCSAPTAEILVKRKFRLNEMGYDTVIDLPSYDFAGKQKERFRYAANWLKRRDFEIRELRFGSEKITPDDRSDYRPGLRDELEELVQSWRATRVVNREVVFLNRPMIYDDESGVRKFFLVDKSGRIEAFVFFDPIYDNNTIVGYVTAFKQRRPDAPSIAEQGITKFAIERFQSEGVSRLTLGLAPMAGIANEHFRCNNAMHYSFRWCFRSSITNRWIYNFKGHAEFKDRYLGQREPTYFAVQTFFNDLRLFAILRMMKVF